jgi:hypothetical protein
VEGACEVGDGVAGEVDDHAVEILEVVGVAAADGQQAEVTVQALEVGDGARRAVVGVEQLKPVQPDGVSQAAQSVEAEADPEGVDVGDNDGSADGVGLLGGSGQR